LGRGKVIRIHSFRVLRLTMGDVFAAETAPTRTLVWLRSASEV
jgi:hypothetical protein